MLNGSAGDDVSGGESYEELYVEHAPAARRVALSMVPPDVADDIVAEAFTRVLGAIRAGGGPGVTFQGYLLASVRNLANDWLRTRRRITVLSDVQAEAGDLAAERSAAISQISSGAEVQAEARAEARLVARAFARLPARWRAVLWHVEVEGEAPAAVAPRFGLSANGVSALAARAREGLRQAYLQEHVGANIPVACRAYRGALGAGARGRLSRRRRVAVDEHLRCCPACTELFSELTELSSRLGAILTPAAVAGASAGLAAGRRALFTRAALAGPGQLWRLHPAGATAGMAAAGALVFAVNVMPPTGSPSHHAAMRPAISASGLASPGGTPGRGTGPSRSSHGPGKTGSLETAKPGGRIGPVRGAAGSSAKANRKAAKKAAIAAKKTAKQQAKASKKAAKQAAKASKQAAKASKQAAKASNKASNKASKKAGKKPSKASLTVANAGGTPGAPVLASMRGFRGHHGYRMSSPAQPRPCQRTAASSGTARRGPSPADK